jgi:hypothetical protein
MNLAPFTADDQAFIASVINHFGDGEHPMAEAGPGLAFFAADYAKKCVKRALKSGRVRRVPATRVLEKFKAEGVKS